MSTTPLEQAQAMVAACAFVPAGMQLPPRTLSVGAPARVLRELRDGELQRKREATAYYQTLTRRCLATLHEVQPLPAPEPDRRRLQLPPVRPLTER